MPMSLSLYFERQINYDDIGLDTIDEEDVVSGEQSLALIRVLTLSE